MLSIFLIGISLSMDAFSIFLSIGSTNIKKKYIILSPIIVGLFHFIMPLLGLYFGNQFLNLVNINPKLIIIPILLYLAYSMYKERNNKYKSFLKNILSIILIAFSVSLDSFSVGIGLKGLTNNCLLSTIIFSLCSGTITYIGLILGKYSIKYLQERSIIVAVIILLLIAFVNLCQIFI